VPYLIRCCMGEKTLMIGTDYGHADSSTELDALTTLKDSGGISAAQHRKIVEDNPRAFYGLS
jgi:predicted TIM-barrel fold metal-dependent hydrolase